MAEQVSDRAVRPDLQPVRPGEAADRAKKEDAASGLLRQVLHDPAFQDLEALWRSVFMLCRRIDTGPDLKIHLVACTKEQLASSLASDSNPEDGGLRRLLGSGRVSLLVAAHEFDGGEDLDLLTGMARLGRSLNAPWVGGCSPTLAAVAAGSGPDAAAWNTLRDHPDAQFLALALPRFLVRVPHGPDSGSSSPDFFHEFPGEVTHGRMVWGNPAMLIALVLSWSFEREGWDFRLGSIREVDQLPYHGRSVSGVDEVVRSAEVMLSDADVAALRAVGLMSVMCAKDEGRVLFPTLFSVARATPRLAGPWA